MTSSEPSLRGHATRPYAEQHFVAGVAEQYEAVYAPSTYDSAIWKLQLRELRKTIRSVRDRSGRMKYLDFACGTGRIVSAVEDLATAATGVDISPLMLDVAARRISAASLRCGDVLRSPELVDDDYDAITAFRFFLNTEADTRLPVMRDLRRRLRGPDSRLIFNVHANPRSVLALTARYRRLRGWPSPHTLSHAAVLQLTHEAGLEIESALGYGFVPRRLYRTRLAGLASVVDAAASRIGVLGAFSQDIVYVCRLRPKATVA